MKARPRLAFDLPVAIATWFGCGYAPVGPGTAGSAAAIVIAIALNRWFATPPWLFAVLAALLLLPGIWAATQIERRLGTEDPGIVVVDEVIGQWVTVAGAAALNWKSWLLAFALFRLFDIWKPFPARKFEKLPEGSGIIADDVMAGIYGAVVIFVAGKLNFY